MSPEIQSQWIEFGGHTPSWLLLSELLSYFGAIDLDPEDLGCTERFSTFLTELGTYGTPETLRIVFWYDS